MLRIEEQWYRSSTIPVTFQPYCRTRRPVRWCKEMAAYRNKATSTSIYQCFGGTLTSSCPTRITMAWPSLTLSLGGRCIGKISAHCSRIAIYRRNSNGNVIRSCPIAGLWPKLHITSRNRRAHSWKRRWCMLANYGHWPNGATMVYHTASISVPAIKRIARMKYSAKMTGMHGNIFLSIQNKKAKSEPFNFDRTQWIYDGSNIIYPSVYMGEQTPPSDRVRLVRGRVREAMRLAKQSKSQLQVLPYFRYVFTDSRKFLSDVSVPNALFNVRIINITLYFMGLKNIHMTLKFSVLLFLHRKIHLMLLTQ